MSNRSATLTFLNDDLSLQSGPASGSEEATVSYPDPELVLQEAGTAVQQAISILFRTWHKGDTGNGISSIIFNADYTMTIRMTDGTSMTTVPLRGPIGVGVASILLNADYTLTITLTDGRVYTTTSIRGLQGAPGPNVVSTSTDTIIHGLLKGNNNKICQAVADIDYQTPIDDLDAIRSGAQLGASALQAHQSLSNYRTSQEQQLIDAGKESLSNKTSSLSELSTNDQYPGAKCVYDLIGDVETLLEALL